MDFRKITLYHYPATRSARVKWILHETIGDNFDVEVVPLYEGKQYSSDYLQHNLNHNVPMLAITHKDGSVQHMLESAAMVTFFADAYPSLKLAPAANTFGAARADYLQMLAFASSWMDMMLWQIRINENVLPKAERDAKTSQRYRHKFAQEVEPQLIARLEAHDYICGDHFTAADIIITHNIMWAKMYGMCSQPAISMYLSRVTKRQAFIKAFSDAHKFTLTPSDNPALAEKFTG